MMFYKTVGQNIKKFRTTRNYSLQTLAEKIGVTKKTVQRYETGGIKIDMERLGDIASALDVKVSELMRDTEQFNEIQKDTDFVLLPIVGRVCCGNGSLAYEDIEGYEPAPKKWVSGGKFFYLRAKGNSMSGAGINDGDLLLIREQRDVENGEIAAVIIDGEARLKRVYKDMDRVVLQSENPNYPPDIRTSGDIRIIGKLKKNIVEY